MVASLVGFVLLAYAIALLTTCGLVWKYIFFRRRNNEPILKQQPILRSQVGATDIAAVLTFLVLGGLLLLNVFGFLLMTFSDMPKPEPGIADIWIQMIIQTVFFMILAATIFACGGWRMFFGSSWSQFLRDAHIGVLAFAALSVPVMLIQVIAAQVTPYEHPLIQVMIDDPQWSILLPVLVSAVLIAPLTEEFFFRLVMQGWLEDLFGIRLASQAPTSLDSFEASEAEADEFVTADMADDSESSDEFVETDINPYSSPEKRDLPPSESGQGWITPPYQPVPILFSSILFSIMHLGQGAAPIPLFLLALGLGYVFQRTRTMTASLVVHFLLNGQSMLLLLIQIFFGDTLNAPPV